MHAQSPSSFNMEIPETSSSFVVDENPESSEKYRPLNTEEMETYTNEFSAVAEQGKMIQPDLGEK